MTESRKPFMLGERNGVAFGVGTGLVALVLTYGFLLLAKLRFR